MSQTTVERSRKVEALPGEVIPKFPIDQAPLEGLQYGDRIRTIHVGRSVPGPSDESTATDEFHVAWFATAEVSDSTARVTPELIWFKELIQHINTFGNDGRFYPRDSQSLGQMRATIENIVSQLEQTPGVADLAVSLGGVAQKLRDHRQEQRANYLELINAYLAKLEDPLWVVVDTTPHEAAESFPADYLKTQKLAPLVQLGTVNDELKFVLGGVDGAVGYHDVTSRLYSKSV